MKKYKKMPKGKMKKGMYMDCTNGVGSPRFWNLMPSRKGVVPQMYMDKVLPMNNDK